MRPLVRMQGSPTQFHFLYMYSVYVIDGQLSFQNGANRLASDAHGHGRRVLL